MANKPKYNTDAILGGKIMDSRSEKLKKEILRQYKSIRAFAKEAEIPHGTLVSALNNNIDGMAWGKVNKICMVLGLDPVTLDPLKSNKKICLPKEKGCNKRVISSNEIEFCASMMCAEYGHLENEVRMLEAAGINSFHIDIMDGRYVPNYAMSLNDMVYIARNTTLPLDVHLMIEHPNTHIDIFLKNLRKGDTVYIHPEAEYHPSTTLQKIIDAGMIPGIAINPGTSIETVVEMLRIVDKVLVMGVNPGNAGQMYLPYVGEKIDKLLTFRDEYGFDIYWDGACGEDKIKNFAPKGVKGFVLGTTVLFKKQRTYQESMDLIREWIKQ